MLEPEQRFDLWQNYKNHIHDFFDRVDDDYNNIFATYNKPKDKDSPFVKKLFDLLDFVHEFVIAHFKELDAEYVAFDN